MSVLKKTGPTRQEALSYADICLKKKGGALSPQWRTREPGLNDCLEHFVLGPTQLVRGSEQLKMFRIKREGAGRVVGLQRPLKVAHIGLGWRGKGVQRRAS